MGCLNCTFLFPRGNLRKTSIVIKSGSGVDLAKGPGPGFHRSTRVNLGQSGKIKKN